MGRIGKWLDGLAQPDQAQRTECEDLAAAPDAWAEMLRQMKRHPMSQVLGVSPLGNIVVSSPRQHVLLLGPTGAGKSAGTLIPNVLVAPGPTVSTSVKEDVYRATGHARSRMGQLWHFDLGGTGTLPGCTPLRWSPIRPAIDWTTASIIGHAMGAATTTGGVTSDNAQFFRDSAGDLISQLLHAAALAEKDMHWVRNGVNDNKTVLRDAEEILSADDSPFTKGAGDDLAGLMRSESRSRSDIFATAKRALSAYAFPDAMATTEEPNFDPDVFVAGEMHEEAFERFTRADHEKLPRVRSGMLSAEHNLPTGSYDTVYMTAGSDRQNLAASVITGLLARIRQARYDLKTRDDRNGITGRPYTLFALDEMRNIAPLHDLPSMLSQSAGQGVLIMGVLQDLSQARAVWDREGEGFLTQFGDIVVYRSIRDQKTLEHISALMGKTWVTRQTVSEQSGTAANPTLLGGPRTSSINTGNTISESEQLIAHMDTSEIANMRLRDEGPQERERVLILQSNGGNGFAFCTPFFSHSPAVEMVAISAAHVAYNGSAFEQRARLAIPNITFGVAQRDEYWRGITAKLDNLHRENNRYAPWLALQPMLYGIDATEAGLVKSLPLRADLREEIIFIPGASDPQWLWDELGQSGAVHTSQRPPRPEWSRGRESQWMQMEVEKFRLGIHCFEPDELAKLMSGVQLDRCDHSQWPGWFRSIGWAISLSHHNRLGAAAAQNIVRWFGDRTGHPVYHFTYRAQLWRHAPGEPPEILQAHLLSMHSEERNEYLRAHPAQSAKWHAPSHRDPNNLPTGI